MKATLWSQENKWGALSASNGPSITAWAAEAHEEHQSWLSQLVGQERLAFSATSRNSWRILLQASFWRSWYSGATHRNLTKEDERKLWDSGLMSQTTPRSLQNAASFTVGKMFCLRGAEHRSLKLSRLKRMKNPDRYVYYENVSKLEMDHSKSCTYRLRLFQCMHA